MHWQFSSSRLHSNSESLALSKHFRGCWASWPQHLRDFSWACFTCGPFSTGWNLEFLHTLGITDASVSRWARPALQLWPLGRTISGWNRVCPRGMVCRRKVVSTDASNLGWGGGALCDVKPVFGLWSKKKGYLHILVLLDSMTVVSYINHQGGLSLRPSFWAATVGWPSTPDAKDRSATITSIGKTYRRSAGAIRQQFGPIDSKIVLNPRHGYILKVLSTRSENRW